MMMMSGAMSRRGRVRLRVLRREHQSASRRSLGTSLLPHAAPEGRWNDPTDATPTSALLLSLDAQDTRDLCSACSE
jgi:hypothetical protein